MQRDRGLAIGERGVGVGRRGVLGCTQRRSWSDGWGWSLVAVHVGALFLLGRLLWDGWSHNLTVNPIQEITVRTGYYAIVLLIGSLVCTPLSLLFGWRWAIPLRRPLGLYAFFYATFHLLTFAWLDYGLDWELIRDAIVEKRYVLVGFAAFLLLLPLAATSTRGWMRRLGKSWKQLHRLVYVAALLAVVHWVMLVKSDIREPLLYGAGVALLLALRLPAIKRWLVRLRGRKGREDKM